MQSFEFQNDRRNNEFMNDIIKIILENTYAQYVLVGFGIGIFVRILMPGPDPMGIIKTTALGIGGSLISGYVIQSYDLGIPDIAVFSSFIGPSVGAFAILGIAKLIRKAG